MRNSDLSHRGVKSLRVLFAVSLFSGLYESVRDRKWRPAGAPTIYRMIEALDGRIADLEVAFCCKKQHGFQSATRVTLSGIKSPVWVIPYYECGIFKRLGMERLYRETRQAIFLMRLHKHKKFDLCYFNNGNLLIAALFAYIGGGSRVVLRVMGDKTPLGWPEQMR